MKNLLFTFFCITVFLGNTFGQDLKNHHWTIEIGPVKSYFSTTLTITDSPIPHYAQLTNSRLLPAIRLARKIPIGKTNFAFQPFIGASISGANKGAIDNDVLRVNNTNYFVATTHGEFKLYHLEFGSFINYQIRNFDIQVGLNNRYHLDYRTLITLDYVPERVRLLPSPFADSNELEYTSEQVVNFSTNAGLRLQYTWARFIFGAEAWYGLTNLSVAKADWFQNEVYENSFRLMFGYTF